ncbi:hypothetical protein B7494_g4744 [Chlorociboria aeruginascens]|nr:hypothetical protein B7494_g4744 [Chlorociboria aeruginascens]
MPSTSSLKQRANHKRSVRLIDDKAAPLQHQLFRKYQSQSLRQSQQRPELSEERVCQAQPSTSLPPLLKPIIAAENEEMHGKSPGKRKHSNRHSTDRTFDGDESSSAEDPVHSSDIYETGDVVSVKRVKPNTSSKLKDAGDYTDSHERKVKPNLKSRWPAYDRYLSEANSLPQYGPFPEKYPVETTPPERKRMKPPCPPGPINTLRRDEDHTPNDQPSAKHFDLTSEYSRPPRKKQKFERPTKQRDSVVIESDEEAPNTSIRARHSEERHIFLDTKESQKPETEKKVQGGQRLSSSSSEYKMVGGGGFSKQANNLGRMHKLTQLEDLTDEISDLEPEPRRGPVLSKNVRVQISVSPKVSHGITQRGTASKSDHISLDDSLDELAIAPSKDETIARNLLADSRQLKRAFDVNKGKEALIKFAKYQDPVNIVPKKYSIAQLFSENRVFLRQDPLKTWFLYQDNKTGDITFRNENDEIVEELNLKGGVIRRMDQHHHGTKLILSRPMDNLNRGNSKIYIELHTAKDCEIVATKLKEKHSNIALGPDVSKLDKIFKHKLQEIDAASKRSDRKDKPADIRLAEQNSERRTEEENKKRKQARQTSVGHKTGNESSEAVHHPQRRENLAKRMRKYSSPSDDEITKNSDPPFRNTTIRNTDFYNTSRPATRNSGRDLVSRAIPRTRSPSPERWTQKNPGWADNWHGSIVFPSQAKNRATVDKADIERLDEGEFLNDNLVDFYLLYLKQCLERDNPEVARRIYFNNTFFYTTLTKAPKGKRRINYEGVERWTKEVDLLQYDYIIVPVNESQHWYVAIICNAPKLLSTKQKAAEQSSSQDGDGARVHKADIDTAPAKIPPPSKSSPQPYAIFEQDVNSKVEELSIQDTPNANEGTLIGPLQPKQETTERPDVEIISDDQQDTSTGKKISATTSGSEGSTLEEDKRPQPKRRGRNSIPSVVRKVDPFQPRIITLDSLGLRHSPTCSNLKEYLVAEIKSKRGIDIVPPTSIGMTANNVPQQKNYCDCGVFVLAYVEKFLKGPDEFINGIMLNSQDVEEEWETPTQLRARIRDMLFNLQMGDAAKVPQVNGGLQQTPKTNKSILSHRRFGSGDHSTPPLAKPESSGVDVDQGDLIRPTIEEDARQQNADLRDIESGNIHSMDSSQEAEEVQSVNGSLPSKYFHLPKFNKTSNQLDSTHPTTMNSAIIDMHESSTKQHGRREERYFQRRPPKKSPRSKTPEDGFTYSKVRGRQPTPFAVRTPGTAESLSGSEENEVLDSDLEDSVQLVDARSRARNLEDQEMLFGTGSHKTSEDFPDIALLRSPSRSPQQRRNMTDDGRHYAENDGAMDGKDRLDTAMLNARKHAGFHLR